MYVLEYLSDPKCERSPKELLTSEYRLLCSGIVYREVGGDPYKSELGRILLDRPFLLFVVSRPLDDFPVELSLELTVPLATEVEQTKSGPSHYIFHPDDEIASDLAALLSLLCRRLITVSGKASEIHSDFSHPLYGKRPTPMPMMSRAKRVSWRLHPMSVLYSLAGHEVKDHNPNPKVLQSVHLTRMLLGLPQLKHAECLVSSCRLYALALELIQARPDLSYPLLISSVETLANAVLEDFQPDEESKIQHKRPVFDMATDLGLSPKDARRLAIEACRGEHWATRKFKRFLSENIAGSIWTDPDDLFPEVSNKIMPARDDLEKVLGMIYRARSNATHLGERLPFSANYVGGPQIETRAATQLFGKEGAFPPVIWFERIVNSALVGFWERAVSANHAE